MTDWLPYLGWGLAIVVALRLLLGGRSQRATVTTFNPHRYPRYPMPGVVVFQCCHTRVGAGEGETIDVDAHSLVRVEPMDEAGERFRLYLTEADGEVRPHRRAVRFNPDADVPALIDAGCNVTARDGLNVWFDTPQKWGRPPAPAGSNRNETRSLSPPPPPPKKRGCECGRCPR